MEKQKDYCRICGRHDYLTKEHLIPESAGNKGVMRARSLSAMTERKPYLRFANGLVRHTLCGACNNLGGNHYVPAFSDWTERAQCYHDRAKGTSSAILSVEIKPLEVVKQIAVLALAMSETCSALMPHYIKLRQFALYPRLRGNLPRFRFYAYLNYGAPHIDGCHCPFRATEGMGPLVYCHVALQPLGYIVTTDQEWCTRWAKSRRLCDLTRYSDRLANKTTNVHLVLPCFGSVFQS